jgi:DNA-directed RNA polymerase specialized sigma24 family protein
MNNEIIENLYKNHKGLIINSVKKGLKGLPDYIIRNELDNLVQDSFISIFEKLPKWDSNKSKITTFASNVAKFIALHFKQKWYERDKIASFETEPIDEFSYNGGYVEVEPDYNENNYEND